LNERGFSRWSKLIHYPAVRSWFSPAAIGAGNLCVSRGVVLDRELTLSSPVFGMRMENTSPRALSLSFVILDRTLSEAEGEVEKPAGALDDKLTAEKCHRY
jgi:hypothetical protein